MIWPTLPPKLWNIDEYNSEHEVSREYRDGKFYSAIVPDKGRAKQKKKLSDWAKKSEKKKPAIHVPYKSNRCVIFDSSLLHATENVSFLIRNI